MTAPSVTHTFTNGTTADATAVNQNFTDLISAMTDGSKSFSIDALTVAGAATLNGAVNLGNATGDDITVNGYLDSSLTPKTDNTYDLGTAAKAWKDAYFDGIVYTDKNSELTSTQGTMVQGRTSGAHADTGYIGEVVSGTISSTAGITSGSEYTFGTLPSLPAGNWNLHAKVYIQCAATTVCSLMGVGIGLNDSLNYANATSVGGPNLAGRDGCVWAQRTVTISTPTTYKAVGTALFSVSTATVATTSQFYAVRIS